MAGAMIGLINPTQEILDFYGKRNIDADVEWIDIQRTRQVLERVVKSDVRYRLMIDKQSLAG